MKNKGLNKRFFRKMICFVIVICFLILSMNPSIADFKKDEKLEQLCYGFIVSPITSGNYTEIDKINTRTRHLINDFLREEITIYWTAEKINIDIKKINSGLVYENKLFESGSFIIPFTGNLIDDNKIISIIYDYNQSSEIEIDDELNVPAYIVLEQISTLVYPLNNVKIALLYSRVTTGDFIFLKLISKCGFLNFDIIKDENVYNKLNNDDFNVILHPGGIYDSLHFHLHIVYEDIAYKKSNGIRSFVNNGGGYIGSCGGLTKASAGGKGGLIPINLFQIYLKKQVYNPNLRSIGVCAIADILVKTPPKRSYDNQVKIISRSSPISFGLDDIVWDYWCGGPEVYHTGENVEVVGVFHNTGTRVDGTPAWIKAEFGAGKVAIFSPHPEIAGMLDNPAYESQSNTGKTVISNSLFYTTAGDKIEYQTYFCKDLSCVYNVWEKTANLTENIIEVERFFDPIRARINNTKDFINYLITNISGVVSLIEDIAKENKVDLTDFNNKYYLGLDYAQDVKKYYYKLFKKFLNDSSLVFDKIELIYMLLKSNTDFNNQLETLLEDISDRLNETKKLLMDSQDMINIYRHDLLNYQKQIFRHRIKENQLKMKGNTLYIHVFSGFSQVPNIYFNSLKFLRYNWYSFEAECSINNL